MPTKQDDLNDLRPEIDPGQRHYEQQVNPELHGDIADLDNLYNSGQEGRSGDLGNGQTDADGSGDDGSDNSDEPDFYNPGDDRPSGGKGGIRSLFSRFAKASLKVHIAAAGLAVAGVLVIVVIVAGLLGISSLQAIHLAQILELDQTNNITYSDLRTKNMYRYVKSGGNTGETRVSYLGSYMFKQSQTDLSNIGVKFNTNENLGLIHGTVIDLDKFPAAKGVPKDKVASSLSDYFGSSKIKPSDVEIRGNQAIIDKDLGLAATKALIKGNVAALDGGKVSSYIKTRLIIKYYGLPTIFHPFRQVDRKINQHIENREQLIKERKAQLTDNGEYESSTRKQAYEDLKSKTSGFRAGADAALLIVGGVCIARSAADDAITYNREAIVIPEALAAANAMAIGSQQQSGMDFDSSQLNVYNQSMTDANGKSVFGARALQAKYNPNNPKGEDLSDEYDQAFNQHTGANTLKNLGGKAGAAACSTPGQVAQVGIGAVLVALSLPTSGGSAFAYGALKAVGGAALGAASMVLVHDLISNSLKDDPIPDNVSAPVKGALLGYGSREYANINAIASGGVELTSQESTSIDRNSVQTSQANFKTEPLYAQLFNVKDYRSSAGRFSMTVGTPKNAVRSMATGIFNLNHTLASIMGGFMPTAKAAAKPFDYGFNRYGIPARILNNPNYDDPYANADKVAALLDSSDSGKYIEKAATCFGVTVAKDSDGRWGVTPEKDVNPNTGEYEDANCDDANDTNWDSMIIFVNDSSDAEADACYLGKTDSCQKFGMTTSNSTNTGAESTFTVASYNMCQEENHPASCPDQSTKVASISSMIGSDGADSKPAFDLVGAQEVSQNTQAKIMDNLTGYQSFPEQVSENNGMAVIWNTSKFQIEGDGHYLGGVWSNSGLKLDGNPVPGNSHPPGDPWVQLKDLASGKDVYLLSIHSPNDKQPGDGASERIENANVYAAWAQSKASDNSVVIITGDFNSSGTTDNGHPSAYCIISGQSTLEHAYDIQQGDKSGTPCPTKDKGKIPIDQIYTSGNLGITASNWTRLDNNSGVTGTDHSPAYVTYTLPGATNTGSVNYKNPIINQQSAGESVIRDGSTFHLFATGSGKIQHFTSTDAVNWKGQPSLSIQGATGNATNVMWKPSIAKVGSSYVMTWAGSPYNDNSSFAIYYATSSSVDGPYKFGNMLVSPSNGGNHIDPQIFADDNGQYYLYYTNGRDKGLQGVQLNVSGSSISINGTPKSLISFDASYGDDWTIEAPYLIKRGGQYYMTFSTGNYKERGNYEVHVARASSPLGPFTRKPKPDVILGNNSAWVGVGTTTVFTDDAGQDWLIYAARYPTGTTDRVSMLDKITYDPEGWPVVNGGQGASSTTMPGPMLAGLGGGASSPGGANSITDGYGPACTGKGGSTFGVACTGQCVDYVEYLLNKTYNSPGKFGSFGTGANVVPKLISAYGMKRDTAPQVGDVASWPAGGVTGQHANSSAGHTAAVIKVNGDGSIIVAEWNWNNDGPVTLTDKYGSHSFDTRLVPAAIAKQLQYAQANLKFN